MVIARERGCMEWGKTCDTGSNDVRKVKLHRFLASQTTNWLQLTRGRGSIFSVFKTGSTALTCKDKFLVCEFSALSFLQIVCTAQGHC